MKKTIFNYNHTKEIMSPKAIKKLNNICSNIEQYYDHGVSANDIILTFDENKVRNDLKTIRTNNPNNYLVGSIGSYSLYRNNGHYCLNISKISTKKLWRILHNFGDALISIQRFERNYVSCNYFGKVFRDKYFKIWGSCPKYIDTGNYQC